MIEFDDRMEKALEAKTAGDLLAIFTDLPDEPFDAPRPQAPHVGRPMPQPMTPHYPAHRPMQSVETRIEKPFYASGGIFWIFFLVMLMTGGRLWPLVVMAALWVWIIGPIVQGYRQPQQVEPQRYYFPVGDIEAEVRALLRANRKIEAVKRYREVYGWGLKEAKDAVDAIEREERGLGY